MERRGRKDADPLRTSRREMGGGKKGILRVMCPRDGVIYVDKSDPDPQRSFVDLVLVLCAGVERTESLIDLQRALYIVVPKPPYPSVGKNSFSLIGRPCLDPQRCAGHGPCREAARL